MNAVFLGALSLSSCGWLDRGVSPPACLCAPSSSACPTPVPAGQYVVTLPVNTSLVVDACQAGTTTVRTPDDNNALAPYFLGGCSDLAGGGQWAALDARKFGSGDYVVTVGGAGAFLYAAPGDVPLETPWDPSDVDRTSVVTLKLSLRLVTPDTVPVAAVVSAFQPPGAIAKIMTGQLAKLTLPPFANAATVRTLMKASLTPGVSEYFVSDSPLQAAVFWPNGVNINSARDSIAGMLPESAWLQPVNGTYFEIFIETSDGSAPATITARLGGLSSSGGAMWFESMESQIVIRESEGRLGFVATLGIVGGVASTIFGIVTGFISACQSGRGFWKSLSEEEPPKAESSISSALASAAAMRAGQNAFMMADRAQEADPPQDVYI